MNVGSRLRLRRKNMLLLNKKKQIDNNNSSVALWFEVNYY